MLRGCAEVHIRAFLPTSNGRFRGYVQFGVGPTITGSRLFTRTSTAETQVKHKEFKVSYNLSGLLGVEGMVADHIGFYAQGGYFFAPSLENLLGDRHQGGGGVVIAGITGRFRIKRGQ